MAQLVEQLIRNEQVVGSSPTISSTATAVRNLPSDPFVWVGGFCYVGRSHIVLILASFGSLLALVCGVTFFVLGHEKNRLKFHL